MTWHDSDVEARLASTRLTRKSGHKLVKLGLKSVRFFLSAAWTTFPSRLILGLWSLSLLRAFQLHTLQA